MIVEDEKIVSKDIQGMLRRIGYAVPAAVSSGEEAVQKAAEGYTKMTKKVVETVIPKTNVQVKAEQTK